MINIKFWTLKILAQITLLIPMGEILRSKFKSMFLDATLFFCN